MRNMAAEMVEFFRKVDEEPVCVDVQVDAWAMPGGPPATLVDDAKVRFFWHRDSDTEWCDFVERMRAVDYDSGYGSQSVFGHVWFEDGTWGERGEYDGSEWWDHKSCPSMPDPSGEEE